MGCCATPKVEASERRIDIVQTVVTFDCERIFQHPVGVLTLTHRYKTVSGNRRCSNSSGDDYYLRRKKKQQYSSMTSVIKRTSLVQSLILRRTYVKHITPESLAESADKRLRWSFNRQLRCVKQKQCAKLGDSFTAFFGEGDKPRSAHNNRGPPSIPFESGAAVFLFLVRCYESRGWLEQATWLRIVGVYGWVVDPTPAHVFIPLLLLWVENRKCFVRK